MVYIAEHMSRVTAIKHDIYLKYLVDILIIDLLVCNVDRHLRNLGVMYNQSTKQYYIAPIFDCGMGFICTRPSLYEYTHGDLRMMMDACYIEHYSESPLDAVEFLTSHELYRRYLFNLRGRLSRRGLVALESWFPTKESHEYFKIIRKELGLC